MSDKASGSRPYLPSLALVLVLLVVIAGAAGAFIYSGLYNIGADAPHSRIVFNALETLRDNSISRHARGIAVPSDLDTTRRVEAGAALYQEMCTGCHLGPGLEKTELSQGLYPAAPELARGDDLSPAEQFWVTILSEAGPSLHRRLAGARPAFPLSRARRR